MRRSTLLGGDVEKLKYYTTAAWLRGYASSFDEENENAKSIVHHLMMASQLLDAVWDEYAREAGYTNAAD